MAIRSTPFHRPLYALVLFALLAGLVGTSLMLRPAYANGYEEDVFDSDFDSLTSGNLSGTAVQVEVGSVRAASTPVAVASVSGLDGKALTVSGAGAAELRFSTYPGPLPQSLNSQRYELRVKAELVAPATSKGATLYLATVGGQRFEIVSFGANGKLARGTTVLNLAYTAGSKVKVEARFDLKNGKLYLKLESSAGSLELDPINLPGNFNPDTVGALIFAAGGATGTYGIDKVQVKVQKEDDDDRDPPARIIITPPPSNNVTIEVINNITLINFNIVLKNHGGRAKNVFLELDCDAALLELLDLSWVSGVGYVHEIRDGKIIIGVGQYNAIRKDTYDLKFKFKLKANRSGDVKIDIKYKVRYSDSRGSHESSPLIIVIVVPGCGIGICPTSTPATTGTPATPTRTGTPATTTPTTTGTPATTTPTRTGTPATTTPTTTGTPATATPTTTGTPATATPTNLATP